MNFQTLRHFFSSYPLLFNKGRTRWNAIPKYPYSVSSSKSEEGYESTINAIKQHPQPDSRLLLGYTCKSCHARTYRSISKIAYSRGVVIVSCNSPCDHKHLIADHLGWFKDWNTDKNVPIGTIEDILKRKGENIQTNFDRIVWENSHSTTSEYSDEAIQIIPSKDTTK